MSGATRWSIRTSQRSDPAGVCRQRDRTTAALYSPLMSSRSVAGVVGDRGPDRAEPASQVARPGPGAGRGARG